MIYDPDPLMPTGDSKDQELMAVYRRLKIMDENGARFASAIRRTFDMLLDGPNTGRYRWDQLHKTEKTHCGTLIEINLQREFGFDDGERLDYLIEAVDVDCKYSQTMYGWMIPPEAIDRVLLVVWGNDAHGKWSTGLVRASRSLVRATGNRDGKSTLNGDGRLAVRWLFLDAPLAENALLGIPSSDVDAILSGPSGQHRLNELVRRTLGKLLTRNVIHTVATGNRRSPILDPLRRLRAGAEGARGQLRDEGIVVLGDYTSHASAAATLGLPIPGPSEFVCVRMVRRRRHHGDAPFLVLDGEEWVVALPDDPAERAPAAPRIKKSLRGSPGTSHDESDPAAPEML